MLQWAVLGCLAVMAAGCRAPAIELPKMPWDRVAPDASAGLYNSAKLEYQLDAGKLGQPLDVVRIDGQRVTYEQVASSPLADQSLGTLTLINPHPHGRAGYAQARFTLSSTRGSGAAEAKSKDLPAAVRGGQPEIHEVWLLDLPREEAEAYFRVLTEQDFFRRDHPEASGARLTVTLDGKQVRKSWEQIPQFNALVQRIRQQGQLVEYRRPGALAGQSYSAITGVQAYQALLAQSGGPAAAPAAFNPAANPFSLTPLPGPPVPGSAAATAGLPSTTR